VLKCCKKKKKKKKTTKQNKKSSSPDMVFHKKPFDAGSFKTQKEVIKATKEGK
jgi:hypothetical protein